MITDACPGAMVDGETDDGVAGGGACNLITRVAHVPSLPVYSWIVQNVMLSSGSICVFVKSPQRRTPPGRSWPLSNVLL